MIKGDKTSQLLGVIFIAVGIAVASVGVIKSYTMLFKKLQYCF